MHINRNRSVMGFTLEEVVPWGRNLEEYRRMFSLTEDDLAGSILGCADGPASVNAELHQWGKHYVSLDPIYQFTAEQIAQRIAATAPVIAEQLEKNQADYQWADYQSPDHLVRVRRAAMDEFLTDFKQNSASDRYITGALPNLPFADRTFDLVLCSHCLFTYSDQLNEAFHQQAVLEMCRVGRVVRIFPLLENSGQPSRHLSSVLAVLKERPITAQKMIVDYEFQRGGNHQLILKNA